MSRLKNYARSLVSSYAQLGASVLYSLVAIPLALSFLPRAEFGLWALLAPIVGYMSLVDLGMTSAVSRLLIDHKDQRATKTYGALIQTAFLVGLVQGAIVFAVVALFAPAIATLLRLPPEYVPTFVMLLRIQGAVSAVAFVTRAFSLILTAHQRMDLCNYGDIFSLLSSLGLLWLFLIHDVGVFSFVYATAIGTLIVPIYLAVACQKLNLFPSSAEWGRVTAKLFREVFSYGKDVFLVALGTQLVMASQTLIVSRQLGLDATAAWTVGTRMFNLLSQLVWRVIGTSMPALSEMITRDEEDRLSARFEGLVALIASFSILLGISFILCNSLFVTVWTDGKIAWSPVNDVLLAIWFFLLSVQGVHNNLMLATKRIKMLRYVFFAEGCVFVILALLVSSRFGVPGIIATSIVCTAVFSFSYGVWRNSDYFARPLRVVALRWIMYGITLAGAFGAVAVITWTITKSLPLMPRLFMNAFTALLIGGFLFVRLGTPPEIRRELVSRLPQGAARMLKYIVPN